MSKEKEKGGVECLICGKKTFGYAVIFYMKGKNGEAVPKFLCITCAKAAVSGITAADFYKLCLNNERNWKAVITAGVNDAIREAGKVLSQFGTISAKQIMSTSVQFSDKILNRLIENLEGELRRPFREPIDNKDKKRHEEVKPKKEKGEGF